MTSTLQYKNQKLPSKYLSSNASLKMGKKFKDKLSYPPLTPLPKEFLKA
jgi:hypothetical protein